MKYFFFILCLFCPLNLYSQGFNGENWREFDKLTKVAFLAGYFTGTKAQFSLSSTHYIKSLTVYNFISDSASSFIVSSKLSKAFDEYKSRSEKRHLSSNIQTDTIIDFIDKFYNEPLNRKIEISSSMICAAASFDGAPENQIAEMIRCFRWTASNPFNSSNYKDYNTYMVKFKSNFPNGLPKLLEIY